MSFLLHFAKLFFCFVRFHHLIEYFNSVKKTHFYKKFCSVHVDLLHQSVLLNNQVYKGFNGQWPHINGFPMELIKQSGSILLLYPKGLVWVTPIYSWKLPQSKFLGLVLLVQWDLSDPGTFSSSCVQHIPQCILELLRCTNPVGFPLLLSQQLDGVGGEHHHHHLPKRIFVIDNKQAAYCFLLIDKIV